MAEVEHWTRAVMRGGTPGPRSSIIGGTPFAVCACGWEEEAASYHLARSAGWRHEAEEKAKEASS
jgi:hypothetical protein